MRRVTLTFPGWELMDVPNNIAELAERRTSHLPALAAQKTMTELLRDAYLQGVHDIAKSARIELKWNGEPLGRSGDESAADELTRPASQRTEEEKI